MKKGYIAMLCILILLITGCSKEYNKTIVCSVINKDNISFVYDSNAKYDEYLIMNNNDVYVVDNNKLFSSTNENCKLLGTLDEKVIGFSGYRAIDEIGRIATGRIDELINGKAYFEEPINKEYMNMKIYVDKFYSKNGEFYTSDGKKVTTSYEDDEKIITVYYQGKYIKTNKHFYKLVSKKENKTECENYSDIKCTYSYYFEIDKKADEFYNDILYVATFQDDKFYGTYEWFIGFVMGDGTIKVFNPPKK